MTPSPDGQDDIGRIHEAVRVLVATVWSPGFRNRFTHVAGQELGLTEIRVLWELLLRGEMQPSRLAAVIDIGAPSISKAIVKLRERGLLTCERDGEDRRRRPVRLSPEGTTAARQLYDAGLVMHTQLLDGWPAEDRERFAELLERYTAALSHDDSPLPTSS